MAAVSPRFGCSVNLPAFKSLMDLGALTWGWVITVVLAGAFLPGRLSRTNTSEPIAIRRRADATPQTKVSLRRLPVQVPQFSSSASNAAPQAPHLGAGFCSGAAGS